MKYGFVIDNRKCIGCHACTTACKSEHQVPLGVNRTWVKQVEKGSFPDTKRLFSVLRCNHCTDAPCVTICPTESLFIRKDGIVDFDKDRCIGCKSCMQACPYDALYIDPDTHTAAKCNYCAHRVDVGLEPACVIVCPEQAIISGDMEDPTTEIAQLIKEQEVKVRKPEKETVPNLFYIDAEEASLVPEYGVQTEQNMWGSQSLGVGHFVKEAEKMAFSNSDVVDALIQGKKRAVLNQEPISSAQALVKGSKEVYNTPDKGMLWGWEVSSYVWTKAISAGIILVLALGVFVKGLDLDSSMWGWTTLTSLVFLTLTGILLVVDLDQPKRFLYVLLRPHWKSWLVKGAYAITIFGAILALAFFNSVVLGKGSSILVLGLLTAFGLVVAIYTAYLFRQAKARDFWLSPILPFHMLLHSILAGAASLMLLFQFVIPSEAWMFFLAPLVKFSLISNLLLLSVEFLKKSTSRDYEKVMLMIKQGRYKWPFLIGVLLLGNIVPLLLSFVYDGSSILVALLSCSLLLGIYINNHIWVEGPQRVKLS